MKFAKQSAMALGFGLMIVGSAVAAPKNKHDGTWKVQMVTDAGICGSSYSYDIVVEKGNVRYIPNAGEASADVYGRIAPSGAVNLDIRRSSAKVDALGSLKGRTGSGTWKVDQYGCTGRWTAQKSANTVEAKL
ncbi:hypothetical protein [Microvirga roseola]|uniref:hypothetical protein n=1 Tax=Microvirga roseola TaxID=2883126 RepID=UPI001E34B80D|nr:hypothetical protein [Microvirga roseola]